MRKHLYYLRRGVYPLAVVTGVMLGFGAALVAIFSLLGGPAYLVQETGQDAWVGLYAFHLAAITYVLGRWGRP